MTEEQNRILYNIGMELSCDKLPGKHLCPRKDAYEYSQCWLYHFSNKNMKMQIFRESGRERIELPYEPAICDQCKEKRVVMIPCLCGDRSKRETCKNKIEQLDEIIGRAISMIAIEKTKELEELHYKVNIPMPDFMDVIDERAMFIHFRSLFQCFLDEVRNGKSGIAVLKRVFELLENWEWFFANRNVIITQIEQYMELAVQGLDLIGCDFPDMPTRIALFKNEMQRKKSAPSLLSFLFKEASDDEKFRESLTILCRFAEQHMRLCPAIREITQRMMTKAEPYIVEELQIKTIRELKKIDFDSDKTEKANAKIIEGYLKTNTRYLNLCIFEQIA